MNVEDIKLIITYFEENAYDSFGTKFLGYDAGKNNLEDHFCKKLKWSKNRLKSTVKEMEDTMILKHHPGQSSTTRLLSLSMLLPLESHLKLSSDNKYEFVPWRSSNVYSDLDDSDDGAIGFPSK